MDYQFDTARPARNYQSASPVDHALRGRLKDLERRFVRLEIVNAALWELIRDRFQLTVDDLEALIRDIDRRDGIEDGKISEVPLKCPSCQRVSSSKHWKCLYCGQEFQRSVFS